MFITFQLGKVALLAQAHSFKVNKRRTVRNKENHYLAIQIHPQIQKLSQIRLLFDILFVGLLSSF